jgi:hypothetical protein
MRSHVGHEVGPGFSRSIAADLAQLWAACEVARKAACRGARAAGAAAIAIAARQRSPGRPRRRRRAVRGRSIGGADGSLAGLERGDLARLPEDAGPPRLRRLGEAGRVCIKVHGRIEQQAGRAGGSHASCVLVRAYAGELAAGMTIPGPPRGNAASINAILTAHAKSLSQILDAGGETKATLPAFPRRPGVADTLRYIPDFISIAGIVIIAEMVLPLTIFGYTYLRLAYRLECADSGSFPPPPQAPILPPPSNRDDRGGPVRLPPPGTNIHAGQARGRRRRLHGGRR